jgi:hypothetical protein
MRCRSQGFEPPRSPLDAHLRKHVHLHDDDDDNVNGNGKVALRPVALRPAGGCPAPNTDAGTQLDFGSGVATLAEDDNAQYAATFRQHLRDGGHGMVASRTAGGRPASNDDARIFDTVTPRPTGGRPVPDYDDGTQPDPGYGVAPLAYDANARHAADIRHRLDVDFGVTPLAVTPPAGRTTTRPASAGARPAPPTVLGSFAVAIAELPDLVDPVDAYR